MRASLLLVALLAAATVSAQEPVFALLDTSEPAVKSMAFDDTPAFALLSTTTTDECECDPCECDPCECQTYAGFLDRVKAVGAGQWVVGPIPANKVPAYAGPTFRESSRKDVKDGVYRVWIGEHGKPVYKSINQPVVVERVTTWAGTGACANGRCR